MKQRLNDFKKSHPLRFRTSVAFAAAIVSISQVAAQDSPPPAIAPPAVSPLPPVEGSLLAPQQPPNNAAATPTPAPDLFNPQSAIQAAPLPAAPTLTPQAAVTDISTEPLSPLPLPSNDTDLTAQSTPAQQTPPSPSFQNFSPEAFPGLYNRNQAADLFRHSSLDEEEGFRFGIGLAEIYTSNLLLSSDNPEQSFRTQVGPSVSYRSASEGTAPFSLLTSYSPSFNFYHGNSSLNEVSHAFDGRLLYNSAKSSVSAGARYTQERAANRFTQGFTETKSLGITSDLKYSISPKTSLNTNLSYTSSDLGVSTASGSNTFSILSGASWQITPLTRIGPSIRYATSESSFGVTRDSVSYLGTLDYELSTKTSFSSTFGVEQVSSSRFEDQTNPTGTISLKYRPTENWAIDLFGGYESVSTGEEFGQNSAPTNDPFFDLTTNNSDNPLSWRASLSYSFAEKWSANANFSMRQSASPTSENEDITDFTQSYSISRRLGISSISAGINFSTIQYDGFSISGSNLVTREDEKTNSYYLSYTYPSIIHNLSSSATIRYTENSGSRDYEETSITLSLGYKF